MDLWFEDAVAIDPRSSEAVRQEVASDLAAGSCLVAVPDIRRPTKQARVSISLDTGTPDAIDTAAKSLKLSRATFIALAMANEIKGAQY